jgi:protein-serine/threonine kinase
VCDKVAAICARTANTQKAIGSQRSPALERAQSEQDSNTEKMANNNGNRFYLNLNSERPQFPDQAYPTTPSTFPNPIFPSQGQGAQQGQGQNIQQQQPYSTGYPPSGYFMNNQYPAAYPQQPPAAYQQSSQAQQSVYQRPAPAQTNDGTNGLVHQFSHQNLGGAARASPYGSRQPSPSQRPRTAGAPAQPAGYGSYLNAPMPSQATQHQNYPEFQAAPEKNPDRYGAYAHTNQKKCASLAEAFFKDSVKRARDRNVR